MESSNVNQNNDQVIKAFLKTLIKYLPINYNLI